MCIKIVRLVVLREGVVQPASPGRLHQLQGEGQQPGVRAGLQPADGRLRGGRELARDLRQSERYVILSVSNFFLAFLLKIQLLKFQLHFLNSFIVYTFV